MASAASFTPIQPIVPIAPSAPSGPSRQRCRRARPLLGTLVEIEARGGLAAQAVQAAFEAVRGVQRAMNRHDPASDIGRFNAMPAGLRIEMDEQTLAVLDMAAWLHQASGGVFDCERRVAPAAVPCGPAWVREGGMVRKLRSACLDLGGIAKGYAVDRAIDAMRAFDVGYALVNAGGDMRHVGAPAADVALREPGAPARIAARWLLDNAALASSCAGGLHSAADAAARIASGPPQPPLPPAAGASVLAPTCMLADALTKVVLAGRAPGHALLEQLGAHTLLYRDGKTTP